MATRALLSAFVLVAAWQSVHTGALGVSGIAAAQRARFTEDIQAGVAAAKGRELLSYAVTTDGASLLRVIAGLQNSKLLGTGLHGGSLAAAVTHRLGLYLLRPPESNITSLVANQTRWLATGAARGMGWQALTGASAAAAAQQAANAGGIALAVVPPGCPSASKGQVALVAPSSAATTASRLARTGPSVALATRTGTAAALFGTCFAKKQLRYYRFGRPANTRPSSHFTRVWLNSMYADAQYLFDLGPGGRGDTVVIFYTGPKIQCFTRYLFISLGFNTTGWTHTAWYRPIWGSAGTKPYHFEYDMPQINFTVFNANQSLIYYKYKHSLSVMAPQPGSGGCASCGFWYAEDPQLALAFYVSARSDTSLKGKLLTFFGSRLVAPEVLTDQAHPSKLRIFYQPGEAVPYEYAGASDDGSGSYSGQLIWVPKWGRFASAPDTAVASFEGARMRFDYYDRSAWFAKGSQQRAGLPKLQW